jgi:photosystem II stability/assembly factor-like uncharacterized protein
MKLINRFVIAGLLSLPLAAMGVAGFVDPLDAPAEMSDLASSSNLLAITSAGSRLIAGGPRGHILYSDDQGSSWKQAEVPASVALTDIRFASAELGWAVGHSGLVLHTRDGGATWERQVDGRQTATEVLDFYERMAAEGDDSAARLRQELAINWQNGPEQPWLGVWFEDDKHGFVVGPFGLIMETVDGGNNWEPWMHRADNPAVLHFNGIEQVGGALYLPSERGLVFRKRAGEGEFVALQTPYSGSYFGVCGDGDLVLAYGLRGTVYASLDQGDSWMLVETGIGTALTGCTAIDGDHAISAASGQLIQVGVEAGSVTSVERERAPWPLTAVGTAEGRPVGVGFGGIWLGEAQPQ